MKRLIKFCAITGTILVIVVAVGVAIIYPLGPREYIYHLQATGGYGPLPLIGEEQGLVERRFGEFIQDLFPEGETEAFSIESDQVRHLVFFENQKVVAVITLTDENGAEALDDFKSVVGKSSQVTEIDDETFWVEPEEYAARLKSAHSFIYATERGVELVVASNDREIE